MPIFSRITNASEIEISNPFEGWICIYCRKYWWSNSNLIGASSAFMSCNSHWIVHIQLNFMACNIENGIENLIRTKCVFDSINLLGGWFCDGSSTFSTHLYCHSRLNWFGRTSLSKKQNNQNNNNETERHKKKQQKCSRATNHKSRPFLAEN